jgi:hypothetical protein
VTVKRPETQEERKALISNPSSFPSAPPLSLGEGIDATEILSDEDIVVHRDASTRNR